MVQLASESCCSKEIKNLIIKPMENNLVAMQNKWYQASQHQHNNSRSCSLSHQKKTKSKKERKKQLLLLLNYFNPSAVVPRRQQRITLGTIMVNILERRHHVRQTTYTCAETKHRSPSTTSVSIFIFYIIYAQGNGGQHTVLCFPTQTGPESPRAGGTPGSQPVPGRVGLRAVVSLFGIRWGEPFQVALVVLVGGPGLGPRRMLGRAGWGFGPRGRRREGQQLEMKC